MGNIGNQVTYRNGNTLFVKMKFLIIYACFIKFGCITKTPSILITKGFDDCVVSFYLLPKRKNVGSSLAALML